MASYQTNLKTWGSTGSEYPDGYNYVEGEQPVDAWDNFFNSNVITDIDHLINLTNDRLESDIGTSFPSSPEDGHLVYRTDSGEEELYVYDSTNSTWHRLMRADAAVLAGDLTASGGETIWDESAGEIPDSAMGTIATTTLDADSDDSGTIDLSEEAEAGSSPFTALGDIQDNQSTPQTIWDDTNKEIPDSALGTIEDSTLADARTDVSDSGTSVVSDVTDINFNQDLNVADDGDGSVTVDVAIGSNPKTYHTDSNNDDIVIYDISGDSLTRGASETIPSGASIAGGNDGNLYMADNGEDEIKIYDISADSWSSGTTFGGVSGGYGGGDAATEIG